LGLGLGLGWGLRVGQLTCAMRLVGDTPPSVVSGASSESPASDRPDASGAAAEEAAAEKGGLCGL